MAKKVIRVGNSLAVTLPSVFIKSLSIQVGDEVKISQNNDTSITFTFTNPHQLPLTSISPSTEKQSTKL